ncbi:MAG: hypothetical protein GXY44_11570 [Phycisphaerales bacterium]|nr:hypothetical protein [Phycisphaerales bacterium]
MEYIICLLITLLSCVPVYFIARRWLGTAWALKAGCVYVAYPGLAWFVADVGPLALLVLLVPATWLLLLRWESGQRATVALCLGAGLAMMYLINFIGLLLLLMMAMGLLLHRPPMRARLISVMAMLLGYAMLVIPARGLLSTTDRAESETAMTTEFWNAIDNGDGSAIAKAARLTKTSPHPLLFLRDQARESPTRLLIWILRRAWRTLYLYSGSYWDQILFSCQLVWLVPASWGWVTAIRCPNRRWAAVLAGGLIFCCWGMVAVVEPLARNMTPLLGITLVFALAGIQDVYIRIARLRVPTPAGKPRLNVVRKRK